MRKKFFLVMTIAVMLFASCKKENYVAYLPATISNFDRSNNDKVHLEAETTDNVTLQYACWNVGDQVVLNSTTSTVSKDDDGYYHIGVVESDRNATTFYSIYPASAVVPTGTTENSVRSITSSSAQVTLPAVQVYKTETVNGATYQKIDAIMAATGTNRLDFVNLCALLEVTVTDLPANAYLTKIEVTTTTGEVLCGTATVNFTNGITLSNLSGGSTIKLQFDGDENVGGVDNPYYIVVPPITSSTQFKIAVHYRISNTTTTQQLYTKRFVQSTASTLPQNKIGRVSFNMSTSTGTTVEHLPGAFSVGSGLQVYFSRGNLLYNDNLSGDAVFNAGWGFEQNQYTATEYTEGSNNSLVTGFMPLHFSTNKKTGERETDKPFLHNNGASTNRIDLPSLAFASSNNWRLLSSSEWQYLIAHANPQFVTVASHPGVMLFPDLFEWPIYNGTQMSQQTSYTVAEWKQLEDAGCVFLISAGYRNKNNGTVANPTSGYYWSNTIYNGQNLYNLNFTPANQISNTNPTIINSQADWGMCLRLVYTPPTTNTTGK